MSVCDSLLVIWREGTIQQPLSMRVHLRARDEKRFHLNNVKAKPTWSIALLAPLMRSASVPLVNDSWCVAIRLVKPQATTFILSSIVADGGQSLSPTSLVGLPKTSCAFGIQLSGICNSFWIAASIPGRKVWGFVKYDHAEWSYCHLPGAEDYNQGRRY